jgi:hypothetical protein
MEGMPSEWTLQRILGEQRSQVPDKSGVRDVLDVVPRDRRAQVAPEIASRFIAWWLPAIEQKDNRTDLTRYATCLQEFGPAASKAVPWLLDRIGRDGPDVQAEHHHPSREAMAHAIIACGSTDQVAGVMPHLHLLTKRESMNGETLEIMGASLGHRMAGRIPGGVRREPLQEALAGAMGAAGESLTPLQFLAGRMAVEIGDDHPVTQRWVDGLASGAVPPVAGQPPIRLNAVARATPLLTWCEQRLDCGGAANVMASSDVRVALLGLAIDGRLPATDVSQDSWRDRASRIIGIAAGAT